MVGAVMVSWSLAASNKGMKQTKPSILELRSLSPVFDGPTEAGPALGHEGVAFA
jgi:hypothetical protein